MSTIAYPSDPVVNGATEIQTTDFAIVPADYTPISHVAAKLFVSRSVKKKLKHFPPLNGSTEDALWAFWMRKDMVSSASPLRNLIAVKLLTTTDSLQGFSPTLLKGVQVPLVSHEIEVHNWFPIQLTLTDGTIFTKWEHTAAIYPVTLDPETGEILNTTTSHRSLYEAIGFVLVKTAASQPSLTNVYQLTSGISPV